MNSGFYETNKPDRRVHDIVSQLQLQLILKTECQHSLFETLVFELHFFSTDLIFVFRVHLHMKQKWKKKNIHASTCSASSAMIRLNFLFCFFNTFLGT